MAPYYISSHSDSLWWLSLEIELGSCCFHLERQTESFRCLGSLALMHASCEHFRMCSDHWNKCHELKPQREVFRFYSREKHTFFSSFLGGSAMVSFARERRSTVEQRPGTTAWAESKTRFCSRFLQMYFEKTYKQKKITPFWMRLLKLIEAGSLWTHFQEKQLDKANL